MSWLQDAGSRRGRGWRDDRPIAQRFEEDVVLVERDVDSGRLVREQAPEDGHTWIRAYASYEALGAGGELVDTVQLRGHSLRAQIPASVGICFRPTETPYDEITIRWPKITPVEVGHE